ncbi:hypothetical protein [Paraburkholderia fungorum]|uniref:hypothetical protein n=1 Tax=Paraburkholderia fungorum TaxID=134537 RepID=UPI0038BA3BF6
MYSSSTRYPLALHTPMPPEVDPDAPLPTVDPNPASEPDENPLPDPGRAPEGDPPVKPPPVSMFG